MKRILFVTLLAICGLLIGAQKQTDQSQLPKYNTLKNPGAENGLSQMAISSSTLTKETTNPLFGKTSFKLDTDADGDYAETLPVDIAEGLWGADCEISMVYRTEAGFTGAGYSLIAMDDSSNPLVSVDLVPATTQQSIFAAFTCPSSGGLKFRLESNTVNGKYVIYDQLWLGSNLHTFEYSESEFIGTGIWRQDTGCSWLGNVATTWSYWGVDNDCLDTTFTGKVSIPATNIPGFRVEGGLEPGNYMISVNGTIMSDTGTCDFRVTDGTNTSGFTKGVDSGPNTYSTGMLAHFQYTEAQGDTTFQLQYYKESGASCYVHNNNTAVLNGLEFKMWRLPLASQKAVTLDTQGWQVLGSIYGSPVPSLGSTDVATYTGVISTGLNLDLDSNSYPAEIACDGTTESSGTTCTGGTTTESVGVSFDIPRAGSYVATFTFGWHTRIQSGAENKATFQLVETPNNAQTISQEGRSRIQGSIYDSDANTTMTNPFTLEGYFYFASAGKKTIRLFFEQQVTGTVTYSDVNTDRLATEGQRDVSFYIRPATNEFPQAVVLPDVVSYVMLDTGSAHGDGTHTKIRDFENVTESAGNCIDENVTSGDSDTDGVELTVLCAGTYQITYVDSNATGSTAVIMGITVNQPPSYNINVSSITPPTKIGYSSVLPTADGYHHTCSATAHLSVGDIIRFGTNGSADSATFNEFVRMVRVH